MVFSSDPRVGKIKNLIEQKLKLVEVPENGDEIVLVKELIAGKSYTVEIGVGKCWKYPSYWDLVGHVYDEQRNEFLDSSIRVEKRLPKSTKVLCGVAKEGFFAKVDKAAMGFSSDSWDGKLDDFINLFENWNNS